jgi:ankyrin repeat protein
MPPGHRSEDAITKAIRANDLHGLGRLVEKNVVLDEENMCEAVECGESLAMVKLIAENLPDDDFYDEGRKACMHTSVEDGARLNGAKYMCDPDKHMYKERNQLHTGYHDTNPLHFVGERTPTDVVQFLANKDPTLVREEDDDGMFPLHAAIRNGADLGAVQILYDKYPRAIVRFDKCLGRLPLHHAAERAKPDVVKFLLSRYKDAARAPDKGTFSLPLHVAAARRVASKRVVRRLVKAWPVAIHEKNRKGLTPLQVAQASGVHDAAVLDLLANGLPK